jgi:hypothetical protein
MKSINLLIGFLIISFLSCANSIDLRNVLKREVTYDSKTFNNNISEECKIESKNSEYNECLPKITLDNYRINCLNIKSEKCQEFYKNPLNYYPICKNIPDFSNLFQPSMIKSMLQGYDIYCQTNENGDLCPFSINVLLKKDNIDILNDQCKSKKCTESLLKIYKDITIDQYTTFENQSVTTGNYSEQELNEAKEIISKLESNECKSSYEFSNNSSDSTIVKYNNILLILMLILLLFY